MKIACLISSLRLGGAERQLAGLAVALSGAGHNVTVITYREGDFYCPLLEKHGVEHVCLEGGGDAAVIRQLADYLKASGTEVLISFLAGTNIKACLAVRRCPGVRLIVSERNFNLSMMPHDRIRFSLYRRYADKVVCNNHSQEAFIRRNLPALRGKVLTISNFVDFESFRPAETAAPSEVCRFVVTARVCRRKNTLGLIRAAKILKNEGKQFVIRWYGLSGKSRYAARCVSLIRKYGLENVFELLPASHDVFKAYCCADWFCLPSMYEGTSNSLAEALACGLPAVCSRISDNPLYAKEGENGFLFDPHSVADIARALSRAMDLGRDEYQEFAAASLRTARSSFTLERLLDSYLRVINGSSKVSSRGQTP